MAKKKYYEGSRTTPDRDMIHEDRSKMSNLPTEVIMKQYATAGYFEDTYLNDSVSGVDNQMDKDVNMVKRFKSDSKY